MGLGVRAGVVSVIPLDCKPDRLLTAIAGFPMDGVSIGQLARPLRSQLPVRVDHRSLIDDDERAGKLDQHVIEVRSVSGPVLDDGHV